MEETTNNVVVKKPPTSVKKSPSFKAESETQTAVAVRVPSLKKTQATEISNSLDRLITAEQTQNASVARRRRMITKNKAHNIRTREKTPEPNKTPLKIGDDPPTTDEDDKVPKSPFEEEADDIYAEMKKKVMEKAAQDKDEDAVDVEALREAQVEEAKERRRRSISPFALPSKEEVANLQRKGSFIDPGNKLLTTVPSYPMTLKDEMDYGSRKNSLISSDAGSGKSSLSSPPPSPRSPVQTSSAFQMPTPSPPKAKQEPAKIPEKPKTPETVTQEALKPTQPQQSKQPPQPAPPKPKPCLVVKKRTNATETNNNNIPINNKELDQKAKEPIPSPKEPVQNPKERIPATSKDPVKPSKQPDVPPVRPKRSKSGTRSQGRTSESEMSEDQSRSKIQAEPSKAPKPKERRKTIAAVKRKEVPPVAAKRSKSVTRTEPPKLDISGIEMTKTSSDIIELLQKARNRPVSIPGEDERITNAVKAYVDRSRQLMTPTRLPSSPRRRSIVTSPKTIEILSEKEAMETFKQVQRKSVEMERTRRLSGYVDASQSEITSSCSSLHASSYSEDESDFDLSKKTAELSRKLALLKKEKEPVKKKSKKTEESEKDEAEKKDKSTAQDKEKEEKNDKVSTKRSMLGNFLPAWREFRAHYPDELLKIRRLTNRCFSDLVLLIILCGLGGIVFRYTEGAFENMYKCGVRKVKRDFIDSLWQGSHNLREEDWKSMARNKLWDFENQLHTAHEAGVTSYSGQKSWSFMNSFVYCLTVVTTIGYGHIAPSTTTGQALTIVYAIFGIPLFLILLADFGKLFTRGIKFLWVFVRRLYYTGSCRKVRKTVPVKEVMKGLNLVYEAASTFRRPSQYAVNEVVEDPEEPPKLPPKPGSKLSVPQAVEKQESIESNNEEPQTPALSVFAIDDEFNLPISVAITILVIYIFVGASIYVVWEEWGFFESFYFVFISMSTIGFGDYVPKHPIYMMLSIVYLVFGLALTSMCINVVQAKLSDSFRQASAKIGATIGLKVCEEDGSLAPVTPPPVELPGVHNNAEKTPENEEASSIN